MTLPPPRLLVVDDEPQEQQLVRTALEKAGYVWKRSATAKPPSL
jgi:CheY-like chemotaxis protein